MNGNQTLEFETFELGGGIGDIGGADLDLSAIDMTDTLIGSTALELTSALGEPSLNEFERYHIGDTGVSDIELTSFDSALIAEAGVRPFDPQNADYDSGAAELAELMGKSVKAAEAAKSAGKKAPKKDAKAKASDKKEAIEDKEVDLQSIVAGLTFLKNADQDAQDLLDDVTCSEFSDDIFGDGLYDENGKLIDFEKDMDKDEDLTDDDFFPMELDEFQQLQEDFKSGRYAI